MIQSFVKVNQPKEIEKLLAELFEENYIGESENPIETDMTIIKTHFQIGKEEI